MSTLKARTKSEARQRTAVVGVRVTPDEREELEVAATAANLSLAAFLRERGLGRQTDRSQVRRSPELDALINLQQEVRRIGVNVNQIAHGVNRDRLAYGIGGASSEDIHAIQSELRKLSEMIVEALR